MGKAFVAKLARQGARDPQALAAWIGRQKFGRKAFQRLAQAGAEREREQREIMGRVRPGGSLTGDLTGLSDADLGRALRSLTADESARVASELDRRDVAANQTGARRDLIGVSDEELGQRLANADAAESAAIAAEMDRRDMLTRMFPGGALAADLTTADDDTLAGAMQYASGADALRIAAEFDRRYPPAPPPAASTAADPVAALAEDSRALDDYLSPLPQSATWNQLDDDEVRAAIEAAERDAGESLSDALKARIAEQVFAERAAADRFEETRSYTRREQKQLYSEYMYDQMAAAEAATNGQLLKPKYRESGSADAQALWSGPAHVAFARASEELIDYWREHGRLTQTEFIAQLTGTTDRAAERASQRFQDHLNKR